MQTITIVDYGMGNFLSLRKTLERLKVEVLISSDPSAILNATKLILPGVGHFGKAMKNLKDLDLVDVLNEAVLKKKTPVLGICLGMQLMAKHSEEGNAAGLGWIDAEVVRFRVRDKLKFKVPHIGWNNINISKESTLMDGVEKDSQFYFVHAYYLKLANPIDELNSSEYEDFFVSAIEKRNIFGVQYHPEKSHEFGEIILKNFVCL